MGSKDEGVRKDFCFSFFYRNDVKCGLRDAKVGRIPFRAKPDRGSAHRDDSIRQRLIILMGQKGSRVYEPLRTKRVPFFSY